MNKNNLETAIQENLKATYGTSLEKCTDKEAFYTILTTVKNIMNENPPIKSKKKIYYISAEFLIGKLLSNNLINLGIYNDVKEILAKNGKDINKIEDAELEPSLGNGGLGRLAACFLDSISTLGLCGSGIGLNYHFGLFKQQFDDNLQMAHKNDWIEDTSWLTKTDTTFSVNFGEKKVTSRLYNIDVVGYKQGVNKLNLFDIESIDETIVTDGINFDKNNIEKNLTLFLYPDDSDKAGHLLRIYQQYFMVSSGIQLILKDMREQNFDIDKLNEHAVIQINDTHPTLAIPELIRILMAEGIDFEKAVSIAEKTFAYTNHTILAEALEKWPLEYLEQVVPQLVPIIKKLDESVKAKYSDKSVHIIDEKNTVHMAHMDIHYSFSVNGVAALHTDILVKNELEHFSKIYPEKFNNKTNGITFRRWLFACNPELTELLTSLIGDDFKTDASNLTKLLEFKNDDKVLEKLSAIKQSKKAALCDYIATKEGINLDPNSIFDIQIKRLHEYKRQQMNALYIIHKILEIKNGITPPHPISFIFGAKAAPAYIIAQDIIHLILVLSNIIKNDPELSKHINVVMVENYNVTYAEKLIPACDISEQISLASKEASGTGNMKFMLNGAVTIGTLDGANVEIADLVGTDNIYLFGKKAPDVIKLYEDESYSSKTLYDNSDIIKNAVDFIVGPDALKYGSKEHLIRLYNEILNKDWFMALLDLEDYITAKDLIIKDYTNTKKWQKMVIENIAKAGFFSSDRTIAEYNNDIWKLK